MKKHLPILLALFLLVNFNIQAQQTLDVVKTKKGTVLKGNIILRDTATVKIQIADGSIYSFSPNEIESYGTETPRTGSSQRAAKSLSVNNFGGQYAIGFSFGDGFIANYRYALSPKTAFEAGIGLGATLVPIENHSFEEDNPFNTESGLQLEAAAHFMGARKENRKGKVKANGIMLRVSHLTGDFATTSLSGGYAVEVFNPNKKKPTRSYIFEAGLKAGFPHWDTNIPGYGDPSPVFPYLRFRWFWYSGKTAAANSPRPGTAPGTDVTPIPGDAGTITQSTDSRQKGGSPIQKGNLMVATATGLTNGQNGNGLGIRFNNTNDVKTSSFGLTPSVGYFFTDGLLGGASVNTSLVTTKMKTQKKTTTLFTFGPFVRYYGALPGNDRILWTGEAAIGFGSSKTKFKNGNNVIENVDGLFSLSIGPGIAYRLHDRLLIEAQALYERVSVKDKETDVETSSASFGLRVGFGVVL